MANYPEAICFDLDGTLIDSAPDLALAVDLTFKEMQRKPCPESKVRQWIGNGVDKLLHRALTNSIDGTADDDLFQRSRALFFKAYKDNIGHSSKLYQGVEETLKQLSGKQIMLACVTNKDRAFTIPLLKKLGVKHFFITIVCGDDVANKKPSPDALYTATEQLGVTTSQCVMVGDSKSDVGAANDANMDIICVDYGYNQGVDLSLLPITAMISDFREIEPLLKEFNLNTVG